MVVDAAAGLLKPVPVAARGNERLLVEAGGAS
jgi:hypothetical protein